MNKRRLVALAIVISVAAILAASFPLTQAKADHCCPTQSQTPKTDTKKSVGTRALNIERQRASARASNIERQRASARASNIERQRASARASKIDKAPVRVKDSNLEKKPVRVETLSLNMIHSRELPIAILSIDKAAKAVESGDKKTALAELDKALNMLITIYGAMGTHVNPRFVNNHCPIMGSPIKPNVVVESLARSYKGQKVAFCCAGCPSAWDKLTDAQKQAKLSKVKL